MLVGFDILLRRVVLVRIPAETTRIERQRIDRSFAVQNRLGKNLARSPRRRDAKTEALSKIKVAQIPRATKVGVAVGRVRDRTIHHILDPRNPERRNSMHRRLDMRRKAIDVTGQQLSAEVRRNAIGKAQLRSPLVGSQDVALSLFAQVVGGIGFAQHRHLGQSLFLAIDQLGNIVGDDILMLNRNNRNIQPHHRRRLTRVVARRSNNRFANNVALRRCNEPFAVSLRRDRLHLRLQADLRTAILRPLRKRHRDIDRRSMPILRVEDGTQQSFRVAQRPKLLDLFRRDNTERNADRVRSAAVVVILLQTFLRTGKAQVARLVERNRLSRLCLQLLVQIDRILVQLPDAVGHVVKRQQSRRMPSRTRRKLGAFQKNDILFSELRQMISDRAADDSAADDDDTRVGFHGEPSP